MSLLEKVEARIPFLRKRKEFIRLMEESSIPEEIYFQIVAEYIFKTPGDILIWGIDQVFWESDHIINALKNRNADQDRIIVLINGSEILPECLENSPFTDIHTDESRTSPTEGFILFGDVYALIWNGKFSTFHPVEKGRVIFRGIIVDKDLIEKWGNFFDKNLRRTILLEEAQQKTIELDGIHAKLRSEKQ